MQTLAHPVTALAVDDARLFVGLGGFGYQLFALSPSEQSSTPALAQPADGEDLSATSALAYELLEPQGVRAARLLINGTPAAVKLDGALAGQARWPSSLGPDGTFEVRSQIETVWGEVISSRSRIVMGEAATPQANPTLSLSLAASGEWTGAPVELRAHVVATAQPVDLVEFYQCASADLAAECELVGSQRGPEYVAYRNLASGTHYFYARAIDDYGNAADSDRVSLVRQSDTQLPSVPIITLAGELGGRRTSCRAALPSRRGGGRHR